LKKTSLIKDTKFLSSFWSTYAWEHSRCSANTSLANWAFCSLSLSRFWVWHLFSIKFLNCSSYCSCWALLSSGFYAARAWYAFPYRCHRL